MASLSEKKGADLRSAPVNLGQGFKKTYTMDNLNIHQERKTVKSFELERKQTWISQVNQLLYVATKEEKFWQLSDQKVFPKNKFNLAPQDRCTFQICNTLAIDSKPKKDRSQKLQIAYLEWQWARDILKTRNLTEGELRKGLKQIRDKIQVFGVERENGLQPIESYTKGTARYDRKKAFEAMDFIKNHCDGQWELYFFTVTCATKIYKNRANAWENYDKTHIKKPLENLRKHYGCEYVRTLESFASGYPHAHCVLAFPKGTYPEWESMENKEEVKSGKIYNWIKNNLGSPVFNLQVAKGDNTKFYLTKYLTKYAKENVLELITKKGKLSKSERKAVQELVYTKAFRKHTLEHCKDRSVAGLQALAEKKAVISHSKKVFEKKQREMFDTAIKETDRARRWRGLLTSLCTNSPLKCNRVIRFMKVNAFRNKFNFYPQASAPLTKAQEKAFNSNCLQGGCSGCFYSELIKFVLGDKNSLFNQKITTVDGKKVLSLFSDSYDLNDDSDFMQCIAEATTHFLEKICLSVHDFGHLAELNRPYEETRDFFEVRKHDEKKEAELFHERHEIWKALQTGKKKKKVAMSVKRCYNSKEKLIENNNPELFNGVLNV